MPGGSPAPTGGCPGGVADGGGRRGRPGGAEAGGAGTSIGGSDVRRRASAGGLNGFSPSPAARPGGTAPAGAPAAGSGGSGLGTGSGSGAGSLPGRRVLHPRLRHLADQRDHQVAVRLVLGPPPPISTRICLSCFCGSFWK